MPKIPDAYALGDRPVPQATPSNVNFSTPATAEALGQAAQTAVRIGEQFKQQQTQQQVFAARRSLNDWEQKNLYDPETGAITKKGSDAFGLPQQLGNSFDQAVSQISGQLQGREAQAAFQELAINRKASVLDWAGRYAANEHLQFNQDQYGADIASSIQRAASDSSKLPLELKTIADRTQGYLSSIGTPQAKIDEAVQAATGKAAFDSAARLLDSGDWQGGQKIVDQYGDKLDQQQHTLLSNKIDADASPTLAQSIYDKHGGNLQASLKEAAGIGKFSMQSKVKEILHQLYSADAANRAQYRLDIQDQLQSAQQSFLQFGTYNGPIPSKAQVVAAYGGQRGEDAYDGLVQMQKLGPDIQAARGATYDEQNKLLAQYAPKPDSNIIQENQNYKFLSAAIEQSRQQREQDPAAFVQTVNPDAKAAYATFAQSLTDQTLNPQQRAEAAQNYAAKSVAAQSVIGVYKPSIVPNGYADWLVQQFDPAKGENTAATLQTEAQKWGKYWPDVYAQVQKELPPAARVIGSGMAPGPAALLAEVAKVPDAEFKASLGAANIKALDDKTPGYLSDFYATTKWNVGGGVGTNQMIEDATKKLAARYVLNGATTDNAMKQAAQDVILGRYTFAKTGFFGDPTYRVPIQYDARAIQTGANSTLDSLTVKDVRLPSTENQESLLNSYKRNSVWATNQDESGLTLIDKDTKLPVRNKDGQPIDLSWQQLLETAKPSKPANFIRGGR